MPYRDKARNDECKRRYRERKRLERLAANPPLSREQKFWRKVDRSGECWIWQGAAGESGHGKVNWYGRVLYAYRVAYELLVGPVPDGHQLHHLCHTPRCVRPDHLRPVTSEAHGVAHRRTHCGKGHRLAGDNLYIRPDVGSQQCRACKKEAKRRFDEKQKQSVS